MCGGDITRTVMMFVVVYVQQRHAPTCTGAAAVHRQQTLWGFRHYTMRALGLDPNKYVPKKRALLGSMDQKDLTTTANKKQPP